MRVSERHQRIAHAQTMLEIELHGWRDAHEDVGDTEYLRLLLLMMRKIATEMDSTLTNGYRTGMMNLIRAHQKEHEMTDIEVLQALSSNCNSTLNYMLRYERHGNYDTPAGLSEES